MVKGQQCNLCRYWGDMRGKDRANRCLRYAPRPISFVWSQWSEDQPALQTDWLRTFPDDWCGEFVSNGENRK